MVKQNWRWTTALSVIALTVLTAGCGGGSNGVALPDTYLVSGTVTFKGKPLEKGTIQFQGADDIAQGRPPGSAEIANGKYQTRMYKGEKSVKISSKQETGKPDVTGMVPKKEIIPKKYNTATTLKTTITEGENTANFDLK